MKRLIAASLLTALVLSTGGFLTLTHAQAPQAADLKPTFISPTPGLYVHGWPAFTLSYPKEWVVHAGMLDANFQAGAPRPPLPPGPDLMITVNPIPAPLSDAVALQMANLKRFGKDFNVLYDRPTSLPDGTPAQEAEYEFLLSNGPKLNTFLLATKVDVTWILVNIIQDNGKVGDDQKRIAYSLKLQRNKEEPVPVPEDVRRFVEKYCGDFLSGDAERYMADFSDQFLYRGRSKTDTDQMYRHAPKEIVPRDFTSYVPTITLFESHGDKAYIDGFYTAVLKGETKAVKRPMAFQQIIKEQGQWKWYGNQK